MREDDARHSLIVGRIAGALFAAGALASAAANQLFRAPEVPGSVYLITLLAVVSGLVCCAIRWDRVNPRWLVLVALVATCEVALTVWSVGPHGPVYAWFYVLIAVFVGYAFSDRRVIAGLSAVAFAAFWLPVVTGSGGPDANVHALVGAPMMLIAAWIVMFLRESLEREREALRQLAWSTREDSLTDALTGLGNRRRLMNDLDAATREGAEAPRRALALFDLDGFKGYNDAFGHPAGDALLHRLGEALAAAVSACGTAYRLGGDEFCVLIEHAGDAQAVVLVKAAAVALSEHGDGFSITASYGSAAIPAEARDAAAALGVADQRMYGHKSGRRLSSARQSAQVLVRLLAEREPKLDAHLKAVALLAQATGRRLGLSAERLDEVVRAAELHDVGKAAIPDAILEKPGPLNDAEWEFIRRHTVVGERILMAAPALRPVAQLVRSSHERYDGGGYPDGLAGEEIPLGARIVGVCDAYEAMTDPDRPYRTPRAHNDALAELRACAGGQFDPIVVEAFCAAVVTQRAASAPV